MKHTLFAGLLAVAGVNAHKTSFIMPESGSERVEHLRRVPEGWNEIGIPSQEAKMHFRVAVRSVRTWIPPSWRSDLCKEKSELTVIG
jgi:tripeptidyl-peptidase-1